MSVKQMSMVFELDLPHNLAWVAMAYADCAWDDGGSCFPSFKYMAWKTGYSEDHIKTLRNQLIERGLMYVVKEGRGRGKPTYLQLTLENGAKKAPYRTPEPPQEKGVENTPFIEEGGIKGGNLVEKRGESRGEKGVQLSPPYPLIEPLVGTVIEEGQEQDDKKKPSKALTPTSVEGEVLKELQQIPNFTRDEQKLLKKLRELETEFPGVDAVEVARDLRWWLDDRPPNTGRTLGRLRTFYKNAHNRTSNGNGNGNGKPGPVKQDQGDGIIRQYWDDERRQYYTRELDENGKRVTRWLDKKGGIYG